MSDCDEHTQRDPDADPPATSTPTLAPGTIFRAVLAHAPATTATTPSSSLSSTPPSPPAPPPPVLSSPPPAPYPLTASEILPRLYISDIFTALNPTTLHALRITHVVSVMEHLVDFPAFFNPHAESPALPEYPPDSTSQSVPIPIRLTTFRVPLMDLPSADIFSYFPTTTEFIATALKDESARVLVHCYKGQSRSPTIVAAYLISTFRISTSDALKAIQAKRPMVLPNRGFRRQLEQYEQVVRVEDEMVSSDK